MFGFLDRVDLWLIRGAAGQLDPVGAPLHPPVAYLGDGPVRTIIPRADTPQVANEPWFGTGHLQVRSDQRVDLVGWSPFLDDGTPPNVAAVVLMPTPFPFEYPSAVRDLIGALEERGVTRERFFLTLQWAIIRNPDDSPLYVVIGTPMRGVRGGELRQHLSGWYVEPAFAWALRTSLGKHDADPAARGYGEHIEKLFLDWAAVARVTWCAVREDRPEIVTRRDQGAPLAWFAGRSVAVWGCGALGGHIAELLARGGVRKLVLRDNGIVTPGLLVRQPFDDADVGRAKAAAVADRVRRIRPDLDVEISTENVLRVPLAEGEWAADTDLVIEATASASVLGLLELRRRGWGTSLVPIVSMAVGHDASRGMACVSFPEHTGGPLDVNRLLKLAACHDPWANMYLDEFWPAKPRPVFQPEPGCSDATFIGSAADIVALSSILLNLCAVDLATRRTGTTATGHFFAQPHVVAGPDESAALGFRWGSDLVSLDVHVGYEVRTSRAAWAEMRSVVERSRVERGPAVETGGLLFGERDDAARVIWVTEASGPPPGSIASAARFVCGVQGTAELNAGKRSRTRGSVHYLGMWHTHPDSLPLPSTTDWTAMRKLVAAAGGSSRVLMLILGRPHTDPVLGTYVVRAADLKLQRDDVAVRPSVVQVVSWSDGMADPTQKTLE